MRASNLQPVIEQLNVNIPLEVDAANIPVWLEALNPQQTALSCGKVLRLLKSLRLEELRGNEELAILDNIRATLDRLAARLEKPLLDAGSPYPDTERFTVEQLIYGYAELAQKYWQAAEYIALPQEQGNHLQSAAGVFIRGMETLRRALLYISLLYDRPYEGFWRLCYRLYRRAELLGILDAATGGHAIGSDSVSNSFKNLLVFYLSDTGLLTQREMKTLYNLFNHRPVLAKIYTELREDKADLLFGFALQSDLPPVQVRKLETREGDMRYFSTMKVAHMAYQYLQGKNVKQDGLEGGNYSLLLKITKTLGMQEPRKYSRVTENRRCLGIIGANKVLRFMMKKNSSALAATMQMLPPKLSKTSSGWAIPDLSLVPVGEEDLHKMKTGKNLASSSDVRLKKLFGDAGEASEAAQRDVLLDEDETFLAENIEILDSSAKNYGILLKNPKTPVKIGDLFGISNSLDDRTELGLVRRITATGKNESELVVELIASQADIGCIWRAADAEDVQMVLLLPGIAALKQKDSIIYPSHAFAIGEKIFIRQGDRKVLCRLHSLLHATNVFSHAELAGVAPGAAEAC